MALFLIFFVRSRVMVSKLPVKGTKMSPSPTTVPRVASWDPPMKACKGTALVHIAISGNQGTLASNHDIGCAHDRVWKRVTAAIDIVELGLGHRNCSR